MIVLTTHLIDVVMALLELCNIDVLYLLGYRDEVQRIL
jgi:hypothetical protein